MNATMTLDNVLDAAEQLDVETQAELVSILSRRLAARGRERLGNNYSVFSESSVLTFPRC